MTAQAMTKTRRKKSMRRVPTDKVFDWLHRQDLSGLEGKWLCMRGRRIAGISEDLEEAIRQAKVPPGETPIVYQVPPSKLLAF